MSPRRGFGLFKRRQKTGSPETRGPKTHSKEARSPSPPMRARVSLLDRLAGLSWKFLLVAAATYLLLYLLVALRVVVLPVIIAMLAATLMVPPVTWLCRHGWPKLLATLTVLLVGLGVVIGSVALLAPSVASELEELGTTAREGFEQSVNWLIDGPLNLSQAEIDRYIQQASDQLKANRSVITSGVLTGALAVGEAVAGLILTLVLVFFFTKDGDKMFDWARRQFPATVHDDITEMGRRAWFAMSAYIRGTAAVALVDAILISILLIVLGVPLVIPLAILTFFGGFFPLVGAVLAGILAALVALVTQGVIDALIVAAGITVIQQVEGDVLQPLLVGRAVRLHPVVVILTLTTGAVVAGVAGAFLAVPVVAVATAVGSYVKTKRIEDSRGPAPREPGGAPAAG